MASPERLDCCLSFVPDYSYGESVWWRFAIKSGDGLRVRERRP